MHAFLNKLGKSTPRKRERKKKSSEEAQLIDSILDVEHESFLDSSSFRRYTIFCHQNFCQIDKITSPKRESIIIASRLKMAKIKLIFQHQTGGLGGPLAKQNAERH